ncbi:MAG TPA: hypothetical protein VF212_06145 [Longimicrobiales bacterium]
MRNILVLVVIGAALGCSSDDGVGPSGPDRTPTSLTFVVQPSQTEGTMATAPAPQVAIQDEDGSTISTATGDVTVALAENPNGATLTGTTTVSAVGGIATFPDLRIDRPGTYRLVATSPGLTQATSEEFRIRLTVRQLSAGLRHTCAITAADVTYCWGHNDAMQLGYRTAVRYSSVAGVVELPAGVVLQSLSLGSSHTCGKSTAGSWYCWGAANYGDVTGPTAPRPISLPTGEDFVSVEADDRFSCGVAASGDAYCWGFAGYEGRLGDGTYEDRFTPTRVLAPDGVRFRRLSRGFAHTCGITVSDALYCWGWSIGPTPAEFTVPDSPALAEVGGGLAYMCASSAAGTIYCWGDNMFGQLGNGSVEPNHAPMPIAEPNGQYVQLAVGGEHGCGLTADAMVYCWGRGGSGQLGNGDPSANSSIPVLVDLPAGVRIVEIAAGGMHTCALSDAGDVYCWGDNSLGQLGIPELDGAATYSAIPRLALQ